MLDPAGLGDQPSDEAIDAYISAVEDKADRITAHPAPAGIKNFLAHKGCRPDLLDEIRRTSMIGAAYLALPRHHRTRPRVKQHMAQEQQRSAMAFFEMTDLLAAMKDDELRAIANNLKQIPNFNAALRREVFAHCEGTKAPKDQVRQAADTLDEAAWKLTHQSPIALVQQELSKLDRACRRQGFERKDWKAHFATLDAKSESPDKPGRTSATDESSDELQDEARQPDGQRKRTRLPWPETMITGGALSVGGLTGGILFCIAGAEPLMLLSCALIPIGILVAIIGGVMGIMHARGYRPGDNKDNPKP